MDKTAIVIVLIIIVLGVGFFVWQSKSASQNQIEPSPLPDGIVLFYGDGCSHCQEVEDFIAQNKIEDRVEITRMEVWYDKNNQATLAMVVKKCGINVNSVGVPFLYDGNGNCYMGEVDVPNFLKTQAGIE